MNRVWYASRCWQQVPEEPDWLTAAERQRLQGFRFDKRRRDWLLGRWTAKHALLGINGLPERDIGRFEIASASDGAPLPLLDGEPCEIGLSLSHSHDRAICAVSADVLELGCDIERVAARSHSFVDTFFTAAECEWVAAADPGFRDTLITLVWSAKESALKTLRHGLRVDTRSVEVVGDGDYTAADWNAARIMASDEGALHCWWRLDGPSVLSVVARSPFRMPVVLESGTTGPATRNPVSARCG